MGKSEPIMLALCSMLMLPKIVPIILKYYASIIGQSLYMGAYPGVGTCPGHYGSDLCVCVLG